MNPEFRRLPVDITSVLLLLCDVIPETEYEWILLIEVLFSY